MPRPDFAGWYADKAGKVGQEIAKSRVELDFVLRRERGEVEGGTVRLRFEDAPRRWGESGGGDTT